MWVMKQCCALALGIILTWSGHAVAGEITVSVAASLVNAMDKIQIEFSKKHPDIIIRINYAASNLLLQQMREGALVDVFASADQATMDRAALENLIMPESRQNFASNALVLIVPSGTDGDAVQAVHDLTAARRIALGNPDSVPAGRYAREAFQSAKLWEGMSENLVFGESVRQVLDYVARAEVDAGVVYATDAALQPDKVRIAAVLYGHTLITYPAAVATLAKNKQEATIFIDFLLSEDGQRILHQFGFISIDY